MRLESIFYKLTNLITHIELKHDDLAEIRSFFVSRHFFDFTGIYGFSDSFNVKFDSFLLHLPIEHRVIFLDSHPVLLSHKV